MDQPKESFLNRHADKLVPFLFIAIGVQMIAIVAVCIYLIGRCG